MKYLFAIAFLLTVATNAVVPALAKVVDIHANGQTFAFAPKIVTLAVGKPTTLHFVATPGAPHGLNVPALGINNVVITPGGTDVTVTPKKTGTYVAHCTIVCGAGHPHMAMTFVVK